jgi:hypothetical protein
MKALLLLVSIMEVITSNIPRILVHLQGSLSLSSTCNSQQYCIEVKADVAFIMLVYQAETSLIFDKMLVSVNLGTNDESISDPSSISISKGVISNDE